MKKWFLSFLICLHSLTFASPIQDHTIDPNALSQLLSALDIHDSDTIAATQKHWLRKAHQERWEIAELSLEQRRWVLDWAEKQGLFADWKPVLKSYDTALILGATTSRMQMRLDYLKKLWLEGTRFHEIVWLTGERPLDTRVDALTDRCQNESDAARVIWEETILPKEMRALPVVFVSVPMKTEGGALKRPNTEDTIVAWLKIAPKPCKALFVSDQPFCGYQFAVIKSSLPDSFQFDLVGSGVDPMSHPSAASVTLDSMARWLYQENLYQTRRNLLK